MEALKRTQNYMKTHRQQKQGNNNKATSSEENSGL